MEHHQVHCQWAGRVKSEDGNIRWACFAANGNFCLATNMVLLQDQSERISNSIVALNELVLFAAKQMVTEGVKRLTAQWAWCTAIAGYNFGANPPP